MSWAARIKAHGQKQARAKAPARPRPKVQEAYFTVRNPSGNDPGEVAPCYFIEEDGKVTLTDRKGNNLSAATSFDGCSARSVAAVLAKARWRADHGGDFNRPINYRPLSIA